MSNLTKDVAAGLAEALAKNGIVSADPPPKPSIRALQAAQQAYIAIGRGNASEWRHLMALRQTDERSRNKSDWKLSGLCSCALDHPDLPLSLREEVQFAWGYFIAKSEF